MSCAEAILFTSQSQLRTSKQSTGEREINVLHGAHSPPARPQINGVIYTASSKTRLEAGSWGLLVQGSASACPKPGSSAPRMSSDPSSHQFWGENTTTNQDGQSWNQTPENTASAASGTLHASAQAAKATTSIQGALDRGALKVRMRRQ